MTPKLAGPEEAEDVPKYLRRTRIPPWESATIKFIGLVQRLESHNPDAHVPLDFATYTDNWASAAWSQLYEADRQACQWAEKTVLMVLTGSYWLDPEQEILIPPATYLKRLQDARQARSRALSRCLSDSSRWKAVRVRGGDNEFGYPILYIGLYLSKNVPTETLRPVVKAHINNCLIATADAHGSETVTTVTENPETKSALINALGSCIPGLRSNEGITAESDRRQKMATALHAAQRHPYSISGNRT